ncbi:MAG TPA: CBS domain-containing protein [Acetobacteraceae bacterium]|nr:CBS domain-containing protein [Acetobacteraceae bacterium]
MSIDAAGIMTTRVIAAGPDDTVAQVARLLAMNQISAMPVCDAEGDLLGKLSESDLLRPFTTEMETRRAWWLRLLAEGTDLAPDFLNYVREDQRRAKDLMVTPVISVTERTSVREVADIMMRHHIKRVPVLRDGKIVGIVARADLVRAIASSPDALSESL